LVTQSEYLAQSCPRGSQSEAVSDRTKAKGTQTSRKYAVSGQWRGQSRISIVCH